MYDAIVVLLFKPTVVKAYDAIEALWTMQIENIVWKTNYFDQIVSQSLVQNYETSILNAKSKQNLEVNINYAW